MKRLLSLTALISTTLLSPCFAENGLWPLLQTQSGNDELVTGSVQKQEKTYNTAFLANAKANESVAISGAAMKQLLDGAAKGDENAIVHAQQNYGAKSTIAALTEWVYLRRSGTPEVGNHAMNFVRNFPDWPESTQLNRMAEQSLLKIEPKAALTYFQSNKPVTGSGKLALARVYAAKGDMANAQRLIEDAFANEPLPADIERNFVNSHSKLISGELMRERMEYFFFKNDIVTATRAADFMGGDAMAYARARAAVIRKAGNAGALLNAVPTQWQREPGFLFAKAQHLRRNDQLRDAANLIAQIPKNEHAQAIADETWEERRLLARQLMDQGDYQLAYKLSADHNCATDIQQMDGEFHAGWIALNYLNDPNRALKHFATIESIAKRPISLARASYWRGRTYDEMGNRGQAEVHYRNAAQFSTTYYGQLARARLGADELALPPAPHASGNDRQVIQNSRIYQAIQLLGKADYTQLMNQFVKDFANRLESAGHLAALGELMEQNGSSKQAVLVGKAAAYNGVVLTKTAFPLDGIPAHQTAGPGVEKSVVYAIARQESEFDPAIRSSAGAVGLMQMLPETAKMTAKKFGFEWQPGQLTNATYNASLGSTHLGELIDNYNGSYILTFVAYNAGPGRVRQWIQKYGDPRDGKTDPIDWVERIPFTETRNYVQRVMENVQVYRARLSGGSTSALLIEKDLMRGSANAQKQSKGFWE